MTTLRPWPKTARTAVDRVNVLIQELGIRAWANRGQEQGGPPYIVYVHMHPGVELGTAVEDLRARLPWAGGTVTATRPGAGQRIIIRPERNPNP